MRVRVRTACLVAAWWLGAATVALAQVPGQAAADSVGRGLSSLRARLDSLGGKRILLLKRKTGPGQKVDTLSPP